MDGLDVYIGLMNVLNVFLIMTLATSACSGALPATRPSPPGTYHETFDDLRAGGFRRTVRIHVPRGFEDRRFLPLVVALHGAFSGAAAMERESGLSRLADREGFVVAYPNGYGFLGIARHWNSGHCCGPARAGGTDDVAFVDRVIGHVSERLPVDPERIYVVGFSNGGMLAHRYAAERAGRVAAVAVVAGTIGGRADTGEPEWRIPAPSRPVPLILLHGTADDRVPYGGTPTRETDGRSWLSVEEAVSFWRAHNSAGTAPETRREGAIVRLVWRGESPVVLLRIEGLGHVWPGRSQAAASSDFDAAEAIWAFFSSVRGRAFDPPLRETSRDDGRIGPS